MKTLKIEKTNDTLYYDTLDNGLQIYMIPKNDINNIFVSFNVKYGAMHSEFIPIDEKKMKSFPHGIAHFLEHKMFEQESGIDPMMFYAANGADINAYTSLYNTAYHFSCSAHLKENLIYLLNFVQSPYFTDENVKKEQGIIEEEIKMYNDDPYSVLEETTRQNGFKDHPIKYTIAGSIEDVYSITKEDLYQCYKTFYHPSNMFLVITGNFNPEEVLQMVIENQQEKRFTSTKGVVIKKYKETDEVNKEYEERHLNVEVSKLAYGIKIPSKHIKMDLKKRDLYLAILFDSLFGATSSFNEEMKEKGLLLSYIMTDYNYTDSHIFVSLSADTENPEELIAAIKNNLTNINISEADFTRKIKMLISSNIYLYDNSDAVNRYIVNDFIMYGKYYANYDNIVKDLNKINFDSFVNNLNFNHATVVVIKPNNKE